jgi:hypothetical protein
VQQQLNAFKDLEFELVYLNDKTFGQAKNYKDLSVINEQIKKFNPGFKGFIIQTTAPQFNKLDEEWLKKSGILYVELGVESYNNNILSKVNKPHRTKTIDAAVEKLRRLNLKFIPNIMVGLAGKDKATGKIWTETAQTYKNTTDFLFKNRDIISHTNTYVLATYKGTELEDQLGVDNDSDADENIVNKSWMKDPKVHEKFYEDVLGFSSRTLKEKAKMGPVDTATEAFKKWFGKSKAKHENGTPVEYYHGTGAVFERFAKNIGIMAKIGRGDRPGYHFHTDPSLAAKYTSKGEKITPNIIPVYIKAENPFDVRIKEHLDMALNVIRKSAMYESWMDSEVRDGDWEMLESYPIQNLKRL